MLRNTKCCGLPVRPNDPEAAHRPGCVFAGVYKGIRGDRKKINRVTRMVHAVTNEQPHSFEGMPWNRRKIKNVPSEAPSPFDVLVQHELERAIDEALETLKLRARVVLHRIFWLEQTNDEAGLKLPFIGRRAHNVSGSRVSQIEHRALRFLRHSSRTKHIRLFWED